MPKPRYSQVSLEATTFYHCVSRCVRRAFLCGTDSITGNTYEHRRQWIEDKLIELSSIFALDLCAYAVMSNHYHVVLHVDKDKASNWTMNEVINQWHQLFSGNMLSQRYIQGASLGKAENKRLEDFVSLWRKRLMDISWFMRVLNEGIARQANKEDSCTGRFWEGRFKSQALLDEAALISCMAYVDLNPVRAAMAKTPETSDHTSVKHRITNASQKNTAQPLFQFAGYPRKDMPEGLPFKFDDYLELLDWTGRILREDKRGFIDNRTAPILQRINIEPESWVFLCKHFESPFKGMVGSLLKLKQTCKKLGYQRMPGAKSCESYFT